MAGGSGGRDPMSDPAANRTALTDEQRQRLAALVTARDALGVIELDSFDLLRCAHWVATGYDPDAKHLDDLPSGDAARWRPGDDE